MRIHAFRVLVPLPDRAAEVASMPYDVVDAAEAAALAAGRPCSLLHVDRAEIDLPPDTDPYSTVVYAKARENFLQLPPEQAAVKCGNCPGCTVQCPYGVKVSERLIRAQEIFAC